MTQPNAAVEYVQLASLIDRHFPGYVETYFGPPELTAEAASGEPAPPEALAERAEAFEHAIAADPQLTPDRRAFLQAEARAMRTTLQILAGSAPSIVDEVRLLYGVTPAWVDESVFQAAHQALDELLPGPEPLAERVRAFRAASQVPVETAVDIMRGLAEEFRSRTRQRFGLPAGEGCEFSLVSDQPWRAYNWYRGQYRSSIEFNQDIPMELWDLPTTAAHETYPGHHAEHALKEERLYRGEGRLEHAIVLSNTPSMLISEGIAANALRAIAAEAEIAALLADAYARAGRPQSEAARAAAFIDAQRQLESVVDNQVLMLYRDQAPEAEVIAYGMRYALTTAEDEIHTLRFIQDPLSRSYTYNYTLGRELVAAWLNRSADRQAAFGRLLSEPLTPAQLMGDLAGEPG